MQANGTACRLIELNASKKDLKRFKKIHIYLLNQGDTLYPMSRYSFALLLRKKVCYMPTCPTSCLFLKECKFLFFANFLKEISKKKSGRKYELKIWIMFLSEGQYFR